MNVSDLTVLGSELLFYRLLCTLQLQSLYAEFCCAPACVQVKTAEKVWTKSVISDGKQIFNFRMKHSIETAIHILIHLIVMLENKWQNERHCGKGNKPTCVTSADLYSRLEQCCKDIREIQS